MFERVRSIIQKQLGKDLCITPDTELQSELNVNSLELVELVCAFEVEFDIVVPEKDIHKFSKVKDIVKYLEKTK